MRFLLKIPFLGLLIFIAGCDPGSINTASQSLKESKLRLSVNSLGFCEASTTEGLKNMELDIEVLGYNGNQAQPLYFQWTTIVPITNDEASWDDIPIEIPEEGTFVVTAKLTATSTDCFSCCQSTSFSSPSPCPLNNDGRLRFAGSSLSINAVPPPANIEVTPAFMACFNCGC
jgi:hypothetical protein